MKTREEYRAALQRVEERNREHAIEQAQRSTVALCQGCERVINVWDMAEHDCGGTN